MTGRIFLILLILMLGFNSADAEKIVYSGDVYMRADVTLNSRCVRILPSGSAVTVIRNVNDWMELDAGGVRGFVRSRYVGTGAGQPLSPVKPVTPVSVSSGTPVSLPPGENPLPPVESNPPVSVSSGTSAPPGGNTLGTIQDTLKQTPVGGNPTGASDDPGLPFKLSEVTWLHSNVSTWPITSRLSSVKVGASTITLDFDKTNVWPGQNAASAFVNANPWIFVQQGGKWYAATWEWMRPGQTTKNRKSVKGDHIKKAPLQNFSPVSGQAYYFMVSGLARFSERNRQERTNIVKVIWP